LRSRGLCAFLDFLEFRRNRLFPDLLQAGNTHVPSVEPYAAFAPKLFVHLRNQVGGKNPVAFGERSVRGLGKLALENSRRRLRLEQIPQRLIIFAGPEGRLARTDSLPDRSIDAELSGRFLRMGIACGWTVRTQACRKQRSSKDPPRRRYPSPTYAMKSENGPYPPLSPFTPSLLQTQLEYDTRQALMSSKNSKT